MSALARYVSSEERATMFLTDAATILDEQVVEAAAVMLAISEVDIRQLERAMTCDTSGNPIRDTPERQEAWATYCAAMDVKARASGWVHALTEALDRRGARS